MAQAWRGAYSERERPRWTAPTKSLYTHGNSNMKRPYSLAMSIVAITSMTHAQSGVLNASEMLPAGSSYEVRTIGNITSIDTSSGTGLVWSNGNIPLLASTHTISVFAPASTAHGPSFPTSNYCVYESVVSRWSYYSLTTDSMARMGFHVPAGPGTYSDLQTELVFPVTVGSSNADTWANNTVSFPGTYSYHVLGSGTLQLPGGSFQDVLLLRVDVVNVFPMRQYLWLSATNGATLLNYTAPSLFGAASGQVVTTMNVGVEETAAQIDLRVHPILDQTLPITYSSAERADVRLLDLTGRVLYTGSLPAAPSLTTEMIPLPQLATGIHLLELSNGHARTVVRFVAGRS